MSVIIGSARVDEKGTFLGGAAGDQKQKTSSNDMIGEVSMQDFYVHVKGWNVIRPKSATHANKIAANMKCACNNSNIGYDQGNRFAIIKDGTNSKVKTECDCSSLVRECVKEATGKDPGNFTTENEVTVLNKTGLFNESVPYTPGYELCTGDILVTKTKGHTVVVVNGASRTKKSSTSGKSDLNKNPKWTGVVSASSLNVRTWAGMENKTCSFGPIRKGTEVAVCDTVKAKDGSNWYYILYKGKYGFVHSKYVKKA